MIEELIDFYNNHLTNWKLIIKKVKFRYYIWPLLFLIIAIIVIPLSYNLQDYGIFIITPIAIFEVFAIFIFNRGCKEVIKRVHNENETKWHYDGLALLRIKKKKLKDFLENDLKIRDQSNIKDLYEFLKEESANSKLNGYFSFGLFLAISIPAWNQASKSILPDDISLIRFIGILLIIAVSIYVLSFLAWGLRQTFDEVLLFKSSKIKRIARYVREIYIEKERL